MFLFLPPPPKSINKNLKMFFCKTGAEKWDGNWSECKFTFVFIKVGEMLACLLMGLNSVERKELMTRERVGISAAMSLSEGSEMRSNCCPVWKP